MGQTFELKLFDFLEENKNRQTCDPDEMCRDVVCNNGGTPRASGPSCGCVCPSGWTGSDCSGECQHIRLGSPKDVPMSASSTH